MTKSLTIEAPVPGHTHVCPDCRNSWYCELDHRTIVRIKMCPICHDHARTLVASLEKTL